MPILPATCLFIRPPVTSAMIWRSRGVNNANLARASELDFSSARRFRSRSSAPVTASSISCSRTGLVRKSIGAVACRAQQRFEMRHVVVAEDLLLATGLAHALDHRIVVERVRQDHAVRDEFGQR